MLLPDHAWLKIANLLMNEKRNFKEKREVLSNLRLVCKESARNIPDNWVNKGNKALIKACREGDTLTVKRLLTKAMDWHGTILPNSHKSECLRAAANGGHTDIVRMLMSVSPHLVPSVREQRYLSLAQACARGHTDIVEILLNTFTSNFNDYWCMHAISKSIYYNRIPTVTCIRDFLLHEVPLEQAKEILEKLLLVATYTKNITIVTLLFEVPTEYQPQESVQLSFQHSCSNGCLEIVTFLMELTECPDPRDNDSYSLMLASRNGHVKVVKFLLSLPLEIRPNINSIRQPLCHSVKYGHYEVTRELLQHKPEFTFEVLLAFSRDIEMLKLLEEET